MTSSYLARWQSPSTSGRPDYQVLYHVDDRTNSSGPLGGNFINVAPIEYGGYLEIFGSGIGPNGELRKSAVYLARKSMAKIDTAGDFERIGTSPVVPSTGIGELSVQYYSDIGKFAMLTQEGQYLRIRFADAPEGPWSTPVVIAALNSADVRQTYCCNGTTCSDSQLYYCNQSNNQNGGFYAPYLLPGLRKNGNNFEISFTVSTWLPYNVALMTASFSLN